MPTDPATPHGRRRRRWPWYQRAWFIVVALLLLFPVGLVLVWRRYDWSVGARAAISTAVAILVIGVTISASASSGSTTANPEPAAAAVTAPPATTAPTSSLPTRPPATQQPPHAQAPPSEPPVASTPPAATTTTAPGRATSGLPAGVDGPFPVTTVVDGDTVKVDEAATTVTLRLIGMDTPETKDPRKPVQCYGPEASARATSLLTGQSVYLEYDPSQGRTDKYDRTLAYLWTPNGVLYNETMIREGYAHEYTYDQPYKYQSLFRAAEAAARAAHAGLWSPSTCNGDTAQSTAQPTPTSTYTPPPAPVTPPTTAPAAVYYPNCSAARAAGAAPLYVGQPGYRPGLDRDHDGVACES